MRPCRAVVLTLVTSAVPLFAQEPSDKPVRHGISIGHYPNVTGLRMNFRDRTLGEVRGANVTIWAPYDGDPGGTVSGFSIGLPLTSAGSVHGVATGLFGAGATKHLTGIGIAPVGIGAGSRLKGIAVAGVGVGGNFQGAALGGIGVGAGGSGKGLLVGGIGAGVGGSFQGIGISGIGFGVGGRLRGIALSGVGIGAGSSIDGIAIAGLGIGSPRIRKFAMASLIGADRIEGLVIAPGMVRLEKGGSMRGVSVSSINAMRGRHSGLAIGLINYARELNGMQIGVINIARNANVKFLPIVNYHRD
jgi:hypothetical protein